MERKALIVYYTMSGNTELVAKRMEKAILALGFSCETICVGKHDFEAEPRYVEDYDLVCFGAPIVAGQEPKPFLNLFYSGKVKFTRNVGEVPGPGSHDTNWVADKTRGVVFTTYGGTGFGSAEALATLAHLTMTLEALGVHVIGEYTAPGGRGRPIQPDENAAQYTLGDGTVVPGSKMFHYDHGQRPNERDLLRAEFLITDLIQDYFFTLSGNPRPSHSKYSSIV